MTNNRTETTYWWTIVGCLTRVFKLPIAAAVDRTADFYQRLQDSDDEVFEFTFHDEPFNIALDLGNVKGTGTVKEWQLYQDVIKAVDYVYDTKPKHGLLCNFSKPKLDLLKHCKKVDSLIQAHLVEMGHYSGAEDLSEEGFQILEALRKYEGHWIKRSDIAKKLRKRELTFADTEWLRALKHTELVKCVRLEEVDPQDEELVEHPYIYRAVLDE